MKSAGFTLFGFALIVPFLIERSSGWVQNGVRTKLLLRFSRRQLTFPALQATSSSKLKTPPPPPKGPRGSVVERLSQAANHAKQKVEKMKRKEKATNKKASSKEAKQEKLGSLQSLTAAIEAKLERSRQQPFSNQNRDAMSEVLRHNQEGIRPYNATVKEVAILLTKPLQNDRITTEHANRVRRLVKAMMEEKYRPNVICFVGPQCPGNLVADADASYLFFQELCAAQKVSVHGIDIHLVKGSVEEGALEQISYFLKETCSPLWTLELHKITGLKQRLHVHFTLVSSEYELCQLNDIHERSPGRSPLRTLATWSSRSFETTWTYLYTTTILPPEESNDVTRMFRTKTYRSAQELIPVLQHIRSVAENREFFQVEAYRVLVAARRSIVKDMELLYHRPKNLRGTVDQEQYEQQRIQPKQQAVDVVLEAAVLSLGRCLDLVRPVGRGAGVVHLSDWRLAAVLLEKAISQILRVCDTDQPLYPHEWGRMGDETDYGNVAEVQEVEVEVEEVKPPKKKPTRKKSSDKI